MVAQVAQAVVEGIAELGLVEGAIDVPALSDRAIAGARLLLVAPPGHPFATAGRLAPALPGNRQLEELVWSLAPDAYWRQRAWRKVAVIAAGPATNVVLALALFVSVFMLGQAEATRIVHRVLPAHPAAAAGLFTRNKAAAAPVQDARPRVPAFRGLETRGE